MHKFRAEGIAAGLMSQPSRSLIGPGSARDVLIEGFTVPEATLTFA